MARCKAVYTGSIPAGAFHEPLVLLEGGAAAPDLAGTVRERTVLPAKVGRRWALGAPGLSTMKSRARSCLVLVPRARKRGARWAPRCLLLRRFGLAAHDPECRAHDLAAVARGVGRPAHEAVATRSEA